jgi:proteasome alpha subunit
MMPKTAYDMAITVFSPDGRLFQVEYAREAVKRGTTTVGVKFKTGVALIVDKQISSHLVDEKSIEKIFKIEDHIGCTTSGLVADARALVDRARLESQIHRLKYDQPIQVKSLVRKICDFKQTYTQYGGVRPFGTSLLIGGVDGTGSHLFATDPSGAMMEYKATAEGEGREPTIEHLEKHYIENMSINQAIDLGIEAIKASNKEKEVNIEVAFIDKKGFKKREINR